MLSVTQQHLTLLCALYTLLSLYMVACLLQGALAACNVDMDIRDCEPPLVPGSEAAARVLFDFCVGDR
jgi:hypothetical protein